MKTLIRKFPVVSYFIIAFGWTWSIVLYMIFSGSVDVNSPTPLFVIGGIICNISPSIAAFIVLKLSEGKEGTAKLVAGFKKKIAARYLIPAVLTVPVITMITAIISSQFLIHYEV